MNINFVNIAIDIVHQINDSPTESVDENDFKIEKIPTSEMADKMALEIINNTNNKN